MSLRFIRILTVLLPILSLCASAGIVSHQYWRRGHLKRELARVEREFNRLRQFLPGETPKIIQKRHEETDSHHGHDHGH
jgi:hypothetical protein